MLRPAAIAVTLTAILGSGLAACASKQVDKVEAQTEQPINCATAEGDIRVLTSEKASNAQQAADGVTAVVPAGAVVGIITGQEGAKFKIASGEYNAMIDKRIAAIRTQCNLPAS
ncbi:MAG: hypothetical protein U1E14_07655 [Geminicoccaceae bacterium]